MMWAAIVGFFKGITSIETIFSIIDKWATTYIDWRKAKQDIQDRKDFRDADKKAQDSGNTTDLESKFDPSKKP